MRFISIQFIPSLPVLVFKKSECDKGKMQESTVVAQRSKRALVPLCVKNPLYENEGDNTGCLGVYFSYESNCASNVKIENAVALLHNSKL